MTFVNFKMTYTSSQSKKDLTDEEFEEMIALKNAINDRIETVIPEKMEEFTEYLVRSLRERGG